MSPLVVSDGFPVARSSRRARSPKPDIPASLNMLHRRAGAGLGRRCGGSGDEATRRRPGANGPARVEAKSYEALYSLAIVFFG